jgi:hypothetical protein
MRVTIIFCDLLHSTVKEIAARTGRTLSTVIEVALRRWIAKHEDGRPAERATLPNDGTGGLMPGVDLNDSAELLDIMEGRDPRV